MREINLHRWAIIITELFHTYVITVKAATQEYLNAKYDAIPTQTLVWTTD